MEENTKKPWPPERRKKKMPKWQRMLRKYWPPIRFGLLIIACVAIVWLSVAGVVKLFSGAKKEPEVTAPTEYVPTAEEIQQMAEELLQEAEFIAAGYDYAKATEMLQSDYGSITNVAQSLGYLTIYDFSRTFKKYIGVSPSNYMKLGKESED